MEIIDGEEEREGEEWDKFSKVLEIVDAVVGGAGIVAGGGG